MNATDVFERTRRNRLLIADLLDSLPAADWEAPTLCDGWSVRHVAAHLLQPMLVGFGRFLLVSLRHRGGTDATVDLVARRLAEREPTELLDLLRRHAGDRVDPPRVGPMGPFVDTCVHLRDIARPLGLAVDVPRDDWLLVLDYLTSGRAAPALVDPRPLSGVSLRATDADWSHGEGPQVAGTVEALAMAVTGRRAVASELQGPGVVVLVTASG